MFMYSNKHQVLQILHARIFIKGKSWLWLKIPQTFWTLPRIPQGFSVKTEIFVTLQKAQELYSSASEHRQWTMPKIDTYCA